MPNVLPSRYPTDIAIAILPRCQVKLVRQVISPLRLAAIALGNRAMTNPEMLKVNRRNNLATFVRRGVPLRCSFKTQASKSGGKIVAIDSREVVTAEF